MTSSKKIILCFFDYFYPAFMSGGPAKSSLGIVEYLREYFDLRVITRDRDTYDSRSMNGVRSNQWNDIKAVKVYYLTVAKYWNVFRVILRVSANTYYFNSFFSLKFTILPLILVRLFHRKKRSIVVAPRGEFSPGAIAISSFKKKLFIKLFRSLYSDIVFHASSDDEQGNIRSFFPSADIRIALNLRPLSEFDSVKYKPSCKSTGELKIVYLSRIEKKKNLDFVLEILNDCSIHFSFDIYGIIDDKEYWKRCEQLIAKLNTKGNAKVQYMGMAGPTESVEIIGRYDVMLFPSLGENFSHAILESFMASRPVIISDRTYWRGLAIKGAGWDLPLDEPDLFIDKINYLASIESFEHDKFCKSAYTLANAYFNDTDRIKDYLKLFN